MLKKYLKDTSGQFAVMFAVCSTALLISMGAAVDIIGMQKEKTQLQALTDAAVLAAAGLKTDNKAEMQKMAQAVFDANDTTGKAPKIKLSVKNDIISVSADTSYTTQLMGVVGYKNLPISAVSEAPIPRDIPMNVSLVLDRTGSMKGDNMTSLKSASSKLIEMFDSFNGEVKVSVVPFANYVNVGLSNRDKNWMNVPVDGSTTGADKCYMTRDLENAGLCTTTKYAGTCSNGDGGSYSCEKTKQTCPDSAYGAEYEKCYTPTSTTRWYGCAGSRDNGLNKVPAYRNKAIPGIMNVSCGEEILPLTNDIEDVKSKINSMSASGNTYIPAGLIWGWRMLDPKAPFDDLSNGQDKRKRALILMTDGANTKSMTQPSHDGSDSDAADTLTAELCADIKKEGIEVYTVAYKLASSSAAKTKATIKACASSDANFFDATDTASLEQAFEEIGRSLFEVRISK